MARRTAVSTAAGIAFIGASALQCAKPEVFRELVPVESPAAARRIQAAMAAVLGSTGIALVVPVLRRRARWPALAVLVGSLPAALQQVRRPAQLQRAGLPPELAPVRIAAQAAMIAVVWYATGEPARTPSPRAREGARRGE
ncbi:hypothetical protein GSY69_05620 [Brevibacterium sp. 5221]|uniref:Uncharacterized protein n=1 Tax=Brevibacterium rongguiense TaxID=2695267 RepID=A0A6N9H685_9MICO|nr:hypothetical protein [Brevibacterium rongguiense]MYM19459.1 hypothetical protein [Brevibacterium rongguiense]